MAALIRHCTIGYPFLYKKNTLLTGITGAVHHDVIRYKTKKPKVKPNFKSKWQWSENSLLARGFLRPLKPYTPATDVNERINQICESNNISSEDSTIINNYDDRFRLFIACEKEFNCTIPNSTLYQIETIADLKNFYQTPINATLPLDSALKLDLPKNLHIETNYLRFHPETDTKFDGKTAFPKSSTLVTGLKYKKKYSNLIYKNPFE